ncbi:hemerythrin-like domain-containing protein [Actinoplanes octamycinicus]|uniref:Hemerythrin-like domain-containing protein n=1 Tax=Actinoplanes octamycinicus TaxID=135948 RepID=A0A7W7H4G5_9ACTN|nr:hemerythrin domain-containing protein [Actinoplanes octamycinicus]MBB4743840.1 hemerythrin-like domain-containing protein [Actinoplanes octamycinicus]
MIMIHRVFRREAAQLQHYVGATATGDVARARQLAEVIREYIGGLHHHHSGEDQLIWPLLHERARLHDDLVSLMERQHRDLDDTLTTVEELLPRWAGTAADPDRAALITALTEHQRVLHQHLTDEETKVMPLVEQHLALAEWERVGRNGLENMPKNKVFLALGAILEDATPEERAEFMKKVPLAGRIAWKLIGQRQYRTWRASVSGQQA